MRKGSAFARIMLVFVIILSVSFSVLLGVFYFTMRDVQIKNRMDALKAQAYDIAQLSAIGPGSRAQRTLELVTGEVSSVQDMLRQKIRKIHDEYAAYSLVVDRTGRGYAYFLSVMEQHPDLQASFDTASIADTLSRVLGGQEVVTQAEGKSGPMFTVAVPMMQRNQVVGAAYIQTAAQAVISDFEGLFKRVFLIALGALFIAGAISFAFSRRLASPLLEMAHASEKLALGDFSHRVTERGSEEMRQLAVAFNTMSEKLQGIEQQRRDFIANISHELRSPMTSIAGFVQAVLDGTVSRDEEKRYLGIVLEETKRLGKLTNTLLNLSRIENEEFKLHPIEFDLNELVRRVLITKMSDIEENRLDIQLDFLRDPFIVIADKDQIEQVLINLIDNAVKFTPDGGWVRIRTELLSSDTARVTVQDDGAGVLKQDAPHVFDRFYVSDKAHTPGRGTGLGLAISKMILEKHGQHIELLPTQRGAAFAFTLRANGTMKEHSL